MSYENVRRNGGKLASVRAVLLSFALSGTAQADQRWVTYTIGQFSNDYRASVTVKETEDVFVPGSISVFETHTGRRVLKVEADELLSPLSDRKGGGSVEEVPYDSQGLLIYEDFNFDGLYDLAIMDGQNSCYHGPSFRIFLSVGADKGSGFRESSAFTELAQENCGMFQIDAKSRTLTTMSKSGCCWHQYGVYKVAGNKPVLIESVEERLPPYTMNYREVTEDKGQSVTTAYYLIHEDVQEVPILLAFDLKGSKGKRITIIGSESTLDYVLTRGAEDEIEFSYLLDVVGNRPGRRLREDLPLFVWKPSVGELSFNNGNYVYTVVDRPDRLGVSVQTGSKTVFLEGDLATRKGTLAEIGADQFENLKTVD